MTTPATKLPAPKLAAARARFGAHGQSVAEWARRHKVSASLVHEILAGRKACRRGASHRIAVLLGLKEGSLDPMPEVTPASTARRAR